MGGVLCESVEHSASSVLNIVELVNANDTEVRRNLRCVLGKYLHTSVDM